MRKSHFAWATLILGLGIAAFFVGYEIGNHVLRPLQDPPESSSYGSGDMVYAIYHYHTEVP